VNTLYGSNNVHLLLDELCYQITQEIHYLKEKTTRNTKHLVKCAGDRETFYKICICL